MLGKVQLTQLKRCTKYWIISTSVTSSNVQDALKEVANKTLNEKNDFQKLIEQFKHFIDLIWSRHSTNLDIKNFPNNGNKIKK